MPRRGKLRGREQEILDLKRQGLTEVKIAYALGVYPNAIRAALKRLAQQSAPQSAEAEPIRER